MNDGEFNIDLEFQKLLENEGNYGQEKAQEQELRVFLEDAQPEQHALVNAFYDHYIALTSLDRVDTLEDFMQASESTPESEYLSDSEDDRCNEDDDVFTQFDQGVAPQLNELMRKEVQQYEVMASGEMQVGGEGMYLYTFESEYQGDFDILESGMRLTGTISQYAALPTPLHEDFHRMRYGEESRINEYSGGSAEILGLWLIMNDAVVCDEAGDVLSRHEQAMVPLELPNLTFNKVIHRYATEAEAHEGAVYAPLVTRFKSELMTDVYRDIENDLNHNEYSDGTSPEEDGDTVFQACARAHEVMSVYMNTVDTEKTIRLTASEARFFDRPNEDIQGMNVQYIEATIIKVEGEWRVVHAFRVWHEGKDLKLAHVLPENITEITYINEV